ncbi:MAG: hypothetical protein GXO07_05735 [Crenarchaeota archaeon]|nr:hypothetical protein [Thermoproteota archaeon]
MEKKHSWLPRALSYFADEDVRNYGMIDRIANAINPNVALMALYDAMRNLLVIVNSDNVEDKRKFASKFGRVKVEGGEVYACFKSDKCPGLCSEDGEECCCNTKALYELAMREVDRIKHELKEFNLKTILELRVIAINALR